MESQTRDELLVEMALAIDDALEMYSQRQLVSAAEIVDTLLDVRSKWLQVVLVDAPAVAGGAQSTAD